MPSTLRLFSIACRDFSNIIEVLDLSILIMRIREVFNLRLYAPAGGVWGADSSNARIFAKFATLILRSLAVAFRFAQAQPTQSRERTWSHA